MAQRTRYFDLKISRLPQVLGLCADDNPRLLDAVNTAQRRLLYAREAGDESWHGTFAEITFNVSRAQPYITLPREIARLELVDVCQHPVAVRNQFFEYQLFGNGRLPKIFRCSNSVCRTPEVFTRNNVPLFKNLTGTPRILLAYPTNQADVKKRVLFQGTDQNGVVVTSQDTFQTVQGVFVSLGFPFVASPVMFNSITGIQKDVTFGPVQIFEVNPSTAAQTLLLTMEPSETTAWYRRYYLDALPLSCCAAVPPVVACAPQSDIVQVTAIAKLDLIPVAADTDYTLIQNLEAIIEEAISNRYETIDTSSAKQMSAFHHKQAIGYLQGELSHWYGKNDVSVQIHPFGSAHLWKQAIGYLT